jgi:hypothetical protein
VQDRSEVVTPSNYRTYGSVIGNPKKIFKSSIEFAVNYRDEKSFPRFWVMLQAGLVMLLINFDE